MTEETPKEETKICLDCGHYMRKGNFEEYPTGAYRTTENPEFSQLWICNHCNRRDLILLEDLGLR